MCVGCGTARSADLVSLEHTPGDGRWIQIHRGAPEKLLEALCAPSDLPDRAEANARIAAARIVLQSLKGEVSLAIDLRSAENGHVSRVKRRGSSVESFYVLPWLIARSADADVRIVRHAHRKIQRSFGERVNTDASTFEMDEVWVRRGGSTSRRPLRRLASLGQAHLAGGSADVPGWERSLPPTAPGFGAGAGQASLAQGFALALVLLVLLPLGLSHLAEPDPGVLPDTLIIPRLAPDGVREAFQQTDRWSRRKALVAAAALDFGERWRMLRSTAADPGSDLDVRLQAVDLLGDTDLGATTLVDLDRRLSAAGVRWNSRLRGSQIPPKTRALLRQALGEAEGVRLQALRRLASLGDPRAVLVARGGLAGGGSTTLRRAWAQTLGGAPAGDPGSIRRLVTCLEDIDPGVRGQAGWALVQVASSGIEEPLLEAFRRTAKEQRPNLVFDDGALALLNLSRALAATGSVEALRREAGSLALSPRVAGEIAFLTSASR